MITKFDIANEALKKLGINGQVSSSGSAEIETAINQLDIMAGELNAENMIPTYIQPEAFGYSDDADDSGLTIKEVNAVSSILAVELISIYPNSGTPTLYESASKGLRLLRKLARKEIKVKYPPTLPIGGGNQRYTDARFYASWYVDDATES